MDGREPGEGKTLCMRGGALRRFVGSRGGDQNEQRNQHNAETHDLRLLNRSGYAKRFGAAYTNWATDLMFGAAILPSVLHQDPRYFYQGTGTKKSRLLHALANPFVCTGDDGHREPNYSSIGGHLISGAISNAYYPASNRGVKLVFTTASMDIAGNVANSVLQEFVFRKWTPAAKRP